ncbi:hypothetical protein [Agrobacterium radiobacter]|uniref:hypothetical protein n=1 Tax=Agrobacterium radiobacter TaxID=362 RepID=UPI003CE5B572
MDHYLQTYIDRYVSILPRETLVYDYKITDPGSVELVYADTAAPDDYADWHLTCRLDQNGKPSWEVDVDCGEGRQEVKRFQFDAIMAAINKLTPGIRFKTESSLTRAARRADR